jgi:hypothetical protein
MKRSPKKLDLRGEMVRILADRELVVVAGGDANTSPSGPAQTCIQIAVPLQTA